MIAKIANYPVANILKSFLIAAGFLAACSALAAVLMDYGLIFVHPHRFDNHVPMLLGDHIGFAWSDLITIFQEFAPGEYRPRFLTYLLILIDLRLRMLLYDTFLLHPGFSVAWILQILAGPWFLFRLVRNITNDRWAALSAVAVYLSSIGFLSGFSMYFMPGKPLSNLIFLAVLYWSWQVDQRAPHGTLFWNSALPQRWWICIAILLGLYLDEMPLFAIALPPLCFPRLFLLGGNRRAIVKNALSYLWPVWVFAVITLVLVPILTDATFGYRFNYLSSLFGIGDSAAGAKSFYEGPYGKFGLKNLLGNFSSLIGTSLMPWQLSPLTKDPSAGGVISGQSNGLLKLLVLLAACVGTFWLAKRTQGPVGALMRRLLLTCILYILFISAVSGRHVPFITGYYYGCAWATLFALLCGLIFHSLTRYGVRASLAGAMVAVAIVAIQIDNYLAVNASYIEVHNEGMARHIFKDKLTISERRPLTRDELNAMWIAWQAGQFEHYLATTAVSTGALFLVEELRWLDATRRRTATSDRKGWEASVTKDGQNRRRSGKEEGMPVIIDY